MIARAADAAHIDRTTFYRRRDSDPDFRQAVKDAFEVATDALETEARRRAHDGWDEPVIYKGELMGVWVNDKGQVVAEGTKGAHYQPLSVRKYSNTLLIFLLKAHRPKKFRDRYEVKHKGKLRVNVKKAEDLSDEQLAEIAARPAE